MDWHKLRKLVEAINTYYAFAVLIYASALYVLSHSGIFLWFVFAATPLLAAWTGYVLRSYLDLRYQRHGFKLVSNVMTYEIQEDNKYVLRFVTTLKAVANHLISYPISYQWTGSGEESVPKVTGDGQELIGVINDYSSKERMARVGPYVETLPYEREWHYWLVGLTPPVNHGGQVQIKYHQEFLDKEKIAKPSLYYTVTSPMKEVELNVKFRLDDLPATVTSSYYKLIDPRMTHKVKGVKFDPDKQWATWTIKNPKVGHCYRIDWK